MNSISQNSLHHFLFLADCTKLTVLQKMENCSRIFNFPVPFHPLFNKIYALHIKYSWKGYKKCILCSCVSLKQKSLHSIAEKLRKHVDW